MATRILLAALRRAAGLSQSALGREAGLNNVTISGAECGRLRLYDSQLDKLARALGYEGDPHDLLKEADPDAQD